jgi:hypothetical protein
MRLNLTPQLLTMLEAMQRQQRLSRRAIFIGPGKATIHSRHAKLAKNHSGPRKPIIVRASQQRGLVPLDSFKCYRTGAANHG